MKRWLPVVRLPHPGGHWPATALLELLAIQFNGDDWLMSLQRLLCTSVILLPEPCLHASDGTPPGERGLMLREPSGSTSHPSMASNRDSSAGGSSSQPQSLDDSSAGKLVTSSLNVLAKPFIGPGTDQPDGHSMVLKSPRMLPVMPGPCPSQVQDMHPFKTRHAVAHSCLTQMQLLVMQPVLSILQFLCMM